jgi:preprotein translocase subunit SecB
MAEDTNTAGVVPGAGAAPQGADQMPVIQIVGQYVKDLSFENPSMGLNIQRPQIDFGIDVQARRIQENAPYEVVLKLRVTAEQEQKTLFLLELAYAGLFVLDKIPEEAIQPILLIECPRLIFPFARRIVADMVSDGGLPPLMIEPIDFAQLYRSRMMQAQQGQQASQPTAV